MDMEYGIRNDVSIIKNKILFSPTIHKPNFLSSLLQFNFIRIRFVILIFAHLGSGMFGQLKVQLHHTLY
jgi:hypothetical protein